MAAHSQPDGELLREIDERREALARSVRRLTREVDRARPDRSLGAKLPIAAGLAGTVGFLRAGGVDATLRLLAERRRERERRRFSIRP